MAGLVGNSQRLPYYCRLLSSTLCHCIPVGILWIGATTSKGWLANAQPLAEEDIWLGRVCDAVKGRSFDEKRNNKKGKPVSSSFLCDFYLISLEISSYYYSAFLLPPFAPFSFLTEKSIFSSSSSAIITWTGACRGVWHCWTKYIFCLAVSGAEISSYPPPIPPRRPGTRLSIWQCFFLKKKPSVWCLLYNQI